MNHNRIDILRLQWCFLGVDAVSESEIYFKKRNGFLFELYINFHGQILIFKDKVVVYFSFCSCLSSLEFITDTMLLQESLASEKHAIHVTDTMKNPNQSSFVSVVPNSTRK